MKSANLRAHLALLGANLIYGLNYTIAKDVMPDYLQPSGFVLFRVIGALSLFWFTGLLVKGPAVEKKDMGRLVLCGLFGVAVNQLFFFEGLSLTSPINAAIIMVATPILVLIFSSVIVKERITINKVIGILIGIGGATLLILGNGAIAIGALRSNPLGDLFIFLNAASYAVYLAMVKALMQKYDPITVIKWVFLWGLVFVMPFGVNQVLNAEWGQIPGNIWLAILFVVLGTTYLAYLLNTIALKAVSPTVTAIYIYLQPLIAAVVALSLGKDEITFVKVASAILIFTGVYMVSRKEGLKSNSKSEVT
jgi:drug/metabolite transporter (DMT)-like permease